MAYSSSIVKTKRDGAVTLLDGAAATYIANFNVGDFSFEVSQPELIVIRDRATIVGARNGDDPTISLSFTCHLRAFHDAGNDALLDFVLGQLSGSVLTSTGGTGYEPFMCDVKYTIDATSLGDAKTYVATFSKCQLVASIAEGDPDSISLSGTCVGGVAFT